MQTAKSLDWLGSPFVAAELLKRGLQTSVTFGNAKAIDLFAHNPNWADIHRAGEGTSEAERISDCPPQRERRTRLRFVVLNNPGEAVQYFIVPGRTLAEEPERFSKWFLDPKFPGFDWKLLRDGGFESAWDLFEQA